MRKGKVIMAGSVKIDLAGSEFMILMYDSEDRLVDRFDVDFGKLTLTRDAAIALSDDVLAYLR